MEFIIYNYSFIERLLLALLVVFFVVLLIQARTIKQKNKAKEKRVLEAFPELTELDLKYRTVALSNYLRYYLFTSKQRAWYTLSILGAFTLIVGGMSSIFLTDKNYIGFFCFAIAYYFIIIFRMNQPSVKKQLEFWKNYLIDHPENYLNVLVTSEDEAREISKMQRKSYIFAFIIATILLLLGIILYIRFQYLYY